LPVYKPFVTYVLLVVIVMIWLLNLVSGSSLIRFGANDGSAILAGETWRLFTSMFLHANLLHLGFNAYALFVFGLEMEGLYGPARYTLIYILSGLFGSLASFAWRGPAVLSVGASGAIFGIIGMNLAFFLLHRQAFGDFGRMRLQNTILIIVVNLAFGFTIPGIDNMAHLGGLIAGFSLGFGLAPRYKVIDEYLLSARLVDRISLLSRWWVPVLGVGLLVGGILWAIELYS
jgi:rhomboid protease GluP